ncbi:MAG: hypothetical protein ABGX03_02225 [Methylophilaceae bacterium]
MATATAYSSVNMATASVWYGSVAEAKESRWLAISWFLPVFRNT